jgi:YidC/Oxa1 family membrane protein insertase
MGAAYQLVTAFAHLLTPLAGGLATVAAIVAFTIGVRLLLSPLSFYGMRGQARIAAIQPRVQELRTRYAKQPDRLQTELGSLYAQEAGGMLAGCLPLLLQLPFFSVMYRLFLSRTVDGHSNGLLSRSLFGTPLGNHWLSGAGPIGSQGLVFLGLFALLAVIGYLSARMSRAWAPAAGTQADGVMGVMMRILPYTTLAIAAFVPLAAGIYLVTTTAWTVAERMLLRRWITPAAVPAAAKPLAGSAPSGPARARRGGVVR